MRKTERVIAAVLAVLVGIIAATGVWIVMFCPSITEEILAESGGKLDGIYYGAGIFSLFIIVVSLFGLAFNLLSPSVFLLIMATSLIWVLLIEPISKIQSGTPLGLGEWIADAVIGLIIMVPLVIHGVRNRLSGPAGVSAHPVVDQTGIPHGGTPSETRGVTPVMRTLRWFSHVSASGGAICWVHDIVVLNMGRDADWSGAGTGLIYLAALLYLLASFARGSRLFDRTWQTVVFGVAVIPYLLSVVFFHFCWNTNLPMGWLVRPDIRGVAGFCLGVLLSCIVWQIRRKETEKRKRPHLQSFL